MYSLSFLDKNQKLQTKLKLLAVKLFIRINFYLEIKKFNTIYSRKIKLNSFRSKLSK